MGFTLDRSEKAKEEGRGIAKRAAWQKEVDDAEAENIDETRSQLLSLPNIPVHAIPRCLIERSEAKTKELGPAPPRTFRMDEDGARIIEGVERDRVTFLESRAPTWICSYLDLSRG